MGAAKSDEVEKAFADVLKTYSNDLDPRATATKTPKKKQGGKKKGKKRKAANEDQAGPSNQRDGQVQGNQADNSESQMDAESAAQNQVTIFFN